MARNTTLWCISIVTAFQMRLVATGSVTEDVPVPGGTVAMARALDIAPTPERARFVAEAARLTHPSAESVNMTRAKAASTLSRMNAVAAARTAMAAAETVPIPLTVAVWSQAVFHRPIAPEAIVAAILADARAAHLSYGLAAV